MPSSVVGTCTTRTPRSQVAATKPPTSVVAPPPTVTTASERVNPAAPSRSQQSATTAALLAGSPSGTLDVQHLVARQVDGQSRRVQQRHPAYAVAQEGRQPVEHAVPDLDVVRRCAGHVDGGHESASMISAATSDGVRSSVSTTRVATDS